jgi:hypothetical protein
MRYQKTEAAPADDLPELSVKEMAFVEAIGEGLNYIDSYRKAYGAEGYSAPSLRVKACRKAAEERIQCHLRALRGVGFQNPRLTLESRIVDELAFAARCEQAGNYGAAGGSYDRINRLCGYYVEKAEITLTSTPEQTLRELELMIGGEPIEVRQH